MTIALTAAALFTPAERLEQPLLFLEGPTITEISSRKEREVPTGFRLVDFGDNVLAPGFIDIHIHGGAGYDVMDSSPEALTTIERSLARHGVSRYFPTTVTAPLDKILAALQRLADAIECAQSANSSQALRAQPLGIHLEGPFISHVRRGVHPPEYLVPPTLFTFERFWEASRGHIHLMTIAPELPGAMDVISEAAKRGVCVCLGHSDSDLSTTRQAVSFGARHATHTFNAMRPLDHRSPGILGEVLTDSKLTADIIADGIHVDPSVVRLFLKAKGPDSSVLITDATAATGMPDGIYHLGGFEVEVKEGMCLAGRRLAGSVLTMDRAIRNVIQFTECELKVAVQMATSNPARVAALETCGTVRVGGPADLVVLTAAGEVTNTIIHGAGI